MKSKLEFVLAVIVAFGLICLVLALILTKGPTIRSMYTGYEFHCSGSGMSRITSAIMLPAFVRVLSECDLDARGRQRGPGRQLVDSSVAGSGAGPFTA
ncbi:hypothetical protein ACQP1G_17485 [Nocardia sp. CA-107356]|uniref:hypothetical protein n=1 Tax=Nocardia sp. CA-107356 TaxID=3239972 RepID=UPI003D949620